MWKLHRKLNFPNIFRLAAIYTWAPAFKYGYKKRVVTVYYVVLDLWTDNLYQRMVGTDELEQWRIRNLKEFQIISTDIPLIIINPLHYNDILSRSAVLSSDSLYYQMLLSCLTQSQYIFLSCCFLSMPVPIWKHIINLHFSRFFAMLFLNACFIQVFQYSLGLNDPNSCSCYKPANKWFF